MDLLTDEWNASYKRKDNYVFYPNEELIRFVSKYIKKKIGLNTFKNIRKMSKCLDLGCGIGRHIIYLDDMKFEVFGIDLSREAIKFAQKWVQELNRSYLMDRIIEGSINDMPFENGFFDFVVSHGVLDSMSFHIAKEAVSETYRVLKMNGLFYFDVISGCDYEHYREYDGEEVVNCDHEKGTIQSYFNYNKIKLLLGDKFKIKECVLIQRESVISRFKNSRYHVIAEKNR